MNQKLSDEAMSQLLRYDPLSEAEDVTGQSYKENDSTMALGFMMMQFNAKAKDAALTAQDDTTFSNKTPRYLRIVEEEGFSKIMDDPIPLTKNGYEGDRNLAFWHDDGILLHFDTYFGGSSINGGNFYFNWKPNEGVKTCCLPLSHGGFGGDYSACSMDCREALRFHLRKLRELGTFCCPWEKQGFMWLLSYADTVDKTYDYKAINAERIDKFPEHVKKSILLGS